MFSYQIMLIDNVTKISGTPQGPSAPGRFRASCKVFYCGEKRTRLRSLLVDPSSLDSSTDVGQRRQGPDARGTLRPSLLSLRPVIMDWGGGGVGLGTSCRTKPGQRKGYGWWGVAVGQSWGSGAG